MFGRKFVLPAPATLLLAAPVSALEPEAPSLLTSAAEAGAAAPAGPVVPALRSARVRWRGGRFPDQVTYVSITLNGVLQKRWVGFHLPELSSNTTMVSSMHKLNAWHCG